MHIDKLNIQIKKIEESQTKQNGSKTNKTNGKNLYSK